MPEQGELARDQHRDERRDDWRDVCCTLTARHQEAHRRVDASGRVIRWTPAGTTNTRIAELVNDALRTQHTDAVFAVQVLAKTHVSNRESLFRVERQRDEARTRAEAAEAQVASLRAQLARVRHVVAANRTGHASPDSMFEGDEQAELAWAMGWRAARDLFARDVDRALDRTQVPAGADSQATPQLATCICQLPGARQGLHHPVRSDTARGDPADAVAWGVRLGGGTGPPVLARDQADARAVAAANPGYAVMWEDPAGDWHEARLHAYDKEIVKEIV